MAGGAQPHQLTAFRGGMLDATLSQPISSSAAPVPLGGGIFIGEGLQPVPSKLADGIWSWEFVEMADLLPEQMAPKKEESALSSLFPARKCRQVTDINLWLQCFLTYISVMSRQFPQDVVELMAYMANIHKASLEFAGQSWVHYNSTFRRQAAASGYRRWSSINASLYSLCFTGKAAARPHCELCFSLAHVTQDCPTTADDMDVVESCFLDPAKYRELIIAYNYNFQPTCPMQLQ